MAVKQLQIAFFALLRSWQGPRWRCFSASCQAIHPSKNNHIIHWNCSLLRIILGQVGEARILWIWKTQRSEKCVIEMKKKNKRRGVIAFKFQKSYLKCFFYSDLIFFSFLLLFYSFQENGLYDTGSKRLFCLMFLRNTKAKATKPYWVGVCTTY